MKKIIPTFSLLLLFFTSFSQNGRESSDFSAQVTKANFVSLTVPFSYRGRFPYLNTVDTIEIRQVNGLRHDHSLLNSLPNQASSVTVIDLSAEVGFKYLTVGLSSKNSSYTVIYDYIKYVSMTIFNNNSDNKDNDTAQYTALVGVGVRMVAKVKTLKSGLKITDLFQLGIEASKSNVIGSLEVQAFGLTSDRISSIIPVTSNLSPTSIENALQAVATIKSLMHESTTKVTPQVIAFSDLTNRKDNKSTQDDFINKYNKPGAVKLQSE
jgi:hypothetical protein